MIVQMYMAILVYPSRYRTRCLGCARVGRDPAQGIVREERYKLERQQVWLEKFLQSKLNEGVSIRGHLR